MSTKHERRTIYLTKRWGLLRRKVLTRDGDLCVRCPAEGRTSGAEIVHHKTAIRDGGDPWSIKNCESVCRPCHAAEHAPTPTPGQGGWKNLVRELLPMEQSR